MSISETGSATHYVPAMFFINGGGLVPTSGASANKGIIGPFPYDAHIEEVTCLLDIAGSCVIDLWKGSVADYLASTIVDGDSITASAPITVSSAKGSVDATLTGWDRTLPAGYVLVVNLDSATTATLITVMIKLRRSAGEATPPSLLAGLVGGYAPLDSGQIIPASYMGSGTSFPSQPGYGNNRPFWRTDHGMSFYYNGTRWICTCPHELVFAAPNALMALSATATDWGSLPLPISRGLDILLEAYEVGFIVAGGGSALDGSNNWVGTVLIRPTGTTVGTLTINSGASSAWRNVSDLTDDVIDLTSAEVALSITWTKTGTPGNLTASGLVTFRFIAT